MLIGHIAAMFWTILGLYKTKPVSILETWDMINRQVWMVQKTKGLISYILFSLLLVFEKIVFPNFKITH